MKSKILLSLLLSVSLSFSGCFGGGETTVENDSTVYDGGTFIIQPAPDWEILEPKDFTSNVSADTKVGFINNVKNEIFNANVNVIETAVDKELTTQDFAKSTIAKQKSAILSFTEIASNEIEISFGKESLIGQITEFEGKVIATNPIVHFKELFIVNNGKAYVVTGAYLPSEDESIGKMIDEMLNSFSLK